VKETIVHAQCNANLYNSLRPQSPTYASRHCKCYSNPAPQKSHRPLVSSPFLLSHWPTDAGADNRRQLLLAHTQNRPHRKADKEYQPNCEQGNDPELNRDVAFLTGRAAPVSCLGPPFTGLLDGGGALTGKAVLGPRILISGLVSVLFVALAVPGAVAGRAFALCLGGEALREDAGEGGGVVGGEGLDGFGEGLCDGVGGSFRLQLEGFLRGGTGAVAFAER